MSSGHFHLTYRSAADMKTALAKAMGNYKFRDRLNSKFNVNRDYDIPYVAGYSKSGKVIYIDRHLPIVLKLAGRMVPILPYLIAHERTEKALIDFMDMDYEEAHKIATFVEHKALAKKAISAAAYEKALDPYIKADQHEKIERVPADLDLKPYRDSFDVKLIAHMKAKMS